jgi:hypothetical protein
MHSLPVASKARRAVHELVDADDEAVDRTRDPRGVQSDGNGSAKVVRLLIGESIVAWRAAEDHAGDQRDAAAMIRLLGMLDAELDRAFPFAIEFVRQGFDERGVSP